MRAFVLVAAMTASACGLVLGTGDFVARDGGAAAVGSGGSGGSGGAGCPPLGPGNVMLACGAQPYALAANSHGAYWLDAGGAVKFAPVGGGPVVTVAVEPKACGVAANDNFAFRLTPSTIAAADLKQKTPLAPLAQNLYGCAAGTAVNALFYLADDGQGVGLWHWPPGTAPNLVRRLELPIDGLAVQTDTIVAIATPANILIAAKDGSGLDPIGIANEPCAIAVDKTRVYWAFPDPPALWAADLSERQQYQLTADAKDPCLFASGGTSPVWADRGAGTVWAIGPDLQSKPLVSGITPCALAAAGPNAFVADCKTGLIAQLPIP